MDSPRAMTAGLITLTARREHFADVPTRLADGLFGSHLACGDPRRGWDFVSTGHG